MSWSSASHNSYIRSFVSHLFNFTGHYAIAPRPTPAQQGQVVREPSPLATPYTDGRIPHELSRPQRRPRIPGSVLERTAMA